MKNAIVCHFGSYNTRRYSSPWICKMTGNGQYDFSEKVGDYTGNRYNGEEGDLYVFDPVESQVYAYGQKDYRGNNTLINFVIWDGKEFVECDRLGRAAGI